MKGNKLGRKEGDGLHTFTLQDLPYIALIQVFKGIVINLYLRNIVVRRYVVSS
jgi:hypothetical protein